MRTVRTPICYITGHSALGASSAAAAPAASKATKATDVQTDNAALPRAVHLDLTTFFRQVSANRGNRGQRRVAHVLMSVKAGALVSGVVAAIAMLSVPA